MNIIESLHSGPPATRGHVSLPGTTDDTSATLPRPPEAAIVVTKKGEAYCATHADHRRDVGRRIEAHLAAAEALIAALDATDPDPDLEPSIGWCNHAMGWRGEEGDDREHDDEREWDPAENGVADQDAIGGEDMSFREWEGDGSGNAIGRALLRRAGIRVRRR